MMKVHLNFNIFYKNYCLSISEVEGIRIGQLSHSEPYDTKKDSGEVDQNADNDYILRKLFKKSGRSFYSRLNWVPLSVINCSP